MKAFKKHILSYLDLSKSFLIFTIEKFYIFSFFQKKSRNLQKFANNYYIVRLLKFIKSCHMYIVFLRQIAKIYVILEYSRIFHRKTRVIMTYFHSRSKRFGNGLAEICQLFHAKYWVNYAIYYKTAQTPNIQKKASLVRQL